MMGHIVNNLIEEFCSEFSGAKKVFVGSVIPRAKALGATTASAPSGDIDNVIPLQDNTFFGSSKYGIVVTEKEFLLNQEETEKPCRVSLSAIHQVTYPKTFWSERLWINDQLVATGTTNNLAMWFRFLERISESVKPPTKQ